jgi:mRNA interferase RelE/StbE
LPSEDRFAVTEGLALYATEGRGDVKKLSGREGYRLRVRDCRVIFDDDGVTIQSILVDGRQRLIRGTRDENPDDYEPKRRRTRRAGSI